jgi:serine/threonine-protein kinase RsbT
VTRAPCFETSPVRVPSSIRVPIREEPDVAIARVRARELALAEGFARAAAEAIATAVTEVARNIVVHAGEGDVVLEAVEERGRRGIVVVARDAEPGIASVEDAMKDGWSTSLGLGLGLPSARRLMDEFTITSALGEGTTVTMTKWAHAPWTPSR